MKRRDLIKRIEDMGCVLIRHGGKHDWYQNPSTGVCQSVPRHREINEKLAKIKDEFQDFMLRTDSIFLLKT